MRRLLAVIVVVLAAAFGQMPAHAQEVTVFAAASLTNAYEEIGKLYREKSGHVVRFSFASSSTLAKQIESGAPANIYASADEPWVDYLAERKLIMAQTRTAVIGNRLVLVMPPERAVKVDLSPGFDLARLLGARGRLATGDPAHVPVGRYAQQALTTLGVWSVAEPRLVRTDSVRAALALVERGEVPAGIVYSTDAAVTPKVRVVGVFPENSHAPIVYPIALVQGQDTPAARDFFRFLSSEDARAVYRKFGFAVRD